MEVIAASIDVQQTQPLYQNVWSSVFIMGAVGRPFVQQSIPITTFQPTIEVALTCAYCQQLGHKFKNCLFVDDKLKRLMKKKLITSLQFVVLNKPSTHVGVRRQTQT
jgi:hypothetical protein